MENVAYLKKPNTSNLIVKRYPDGTFTTGRSQPPKVDKHYKPLEGISSHTTFYGATKVSIGARQLEKDADPATLERIALDYEKAGNQEMANYFADRYASEILSGRYEVENSDRYVVDGDDLAVSPMGLSDATICHKSSTKNSKKAAKRGSKGITTHGKRQVRCGCVLLEQKYTKNCLSFLTATLPAFSNVLEFRLICKNWSYLVRAFVQELKRILARRGISQSMVWVTEIQEDRYQYSGEVAPHLHLVMVGKKNRFDKHWAISKGEVRSLWERLLGNLLGRPVTCQAATRVERPRKSLQGEFSSYLSKGGKMFEQIVKDGKSDQLPSNYSGCTDNLKRAIESLTERLTGEAAEKFIDNLENMKQAGLLFYKPIIIYAPNLGRDITVGYVGWIKESKIVTEFLAA